MLPDLSDNIIYAGLIESLEKWDKKLGSTVPLMIDAMNRGLDRFPQLDTALKAADLTDPTIHAYRQAFQLYAERLEAHYNNYGDWPLAIKLPKPVNDAQHYVWGLAEAFLHYKTGKKPQLHGF